MKKALILLLIAPLLSLNAVEPVLILGGGMGSLTSALYMARAGLQPIVVEGPTPGGLLVQSHMVQNWPGEMEITGALLAKKMRQQAEANGAYFLNEEVVAVDFSKRPFSVTTRSLDGKERRRQIQAESCIIAMGTTSNYLGIPGEKEYWGRGVTNCAVCDGALFQERIVGVVGGGDAAVLEALYLSNIAKQVYVFVRKDSLRAIEEKRVEILRAKPNVKIVYRTTVEEVIGDGENVTQVVLKTGSGKKETWDLDGLFLAIGSKPNSQIFQNILKLDPQGYILLTKDQQTSIEGIYAVGDISDPVYKQAVTASGDGAKAALQAQNYLSDRLPVKPVATLERKSEQEVAANVSYESNVIEIDSADQLKQELTGSPIPVLVDFYATWCGPCKQIAPALKTAAAKLDGKVKFLKVDVDRFPELVSKYSIRAMPTVLLLDPSGKIKERKVGPDEIAKLLNRL